MKKLCIPGTALLLTLLTGCYTSRQVATMQGHGTKQVFNASYDQAWRAAVDAAQQPGLSIVSADRTAGYISTHRTIRPHTFGENVGIWVKSQSPDQTMVEVVSRQAGPPVAWLKNWENEVLRSVGANLTREVPTAVGTASTETYTTTGSSQFSTPATYDQSTTSTLNQGSTSQQIAQEQRRLEEIRQEQEQRREELAREQDQGRREKLNNEIERLRGELRSIENRLSELEAEQKQLK